MAKDLTFAQTLKRLEEIIEKLETKNTELEEGLALLTEGLKLHKICQNKLKHAQKKIDKIMLESEVN